LKEFRGKGLVAPLNVYAIDILAPKTGAHLFFGEAVCNHTVIQKMEMKRGHRCLGLQMEIIPAADARRTSLLMMGQVLVDNPHTVYLPEKLLDFANKRYEIFNISRTVMKSTKTPQGETVLTSEAYEVAGIIKIAVTKIGSDLRECVHKIIANEAFPIAHVQLNLADQCSGWAYEELFKEGFFLGGILPIWFGTDGLLLQRLSEKPDFDSLKLYSEDAFYIRDYVREEAERLTTGFCLAE
jgi:hypothetical protein